MKSLTPPLGIARATSRFAAWCLFMLCATNLSAQEIVDTWRYTLTKPPVGWEQSDFDDSGWTEANGGFGTSDTPGSRVGTTWSTNNIWLRKSYRLDKVPANPNLWAHYDEDGEVYLNGTQVATLKGYIVEYKLVTIPADKRAALKEGKNVMAVHCGQKGGGQFIDVHLIDGDKAPKLPRPTKPFLTELITKWGAEVKPDNAWTEYPRPELERRNWKNLNGQWDYAVTANDVTDTPSKWDGKILVPFCLESKLGGVQRLLDGSEALWYHRTFDAKVTPGMRQLLNLEAVDYRCEVFVNGKSVGKHTGGNTPFSFDITSAVKNGENQLVIRVEDETEAFQLRGKQVLNAHGIWYTQVSGIWQTVWLEEVPDRYIKDLKIATDAAARTITVKPVFEGIGQVKIVVKDGDKVVEDYTIIVRGDGTDEIELKIPDAKLWTPSTPHLYTLDVTLTCSDGKVADQVKSYAGIRTVGKMKDADGNWHFTLNGNIIFHWGPLDQGWWPDGLLTPPSDEAMLSDIEFLKSAGFNMIRKHIKVEPRRYYYHCDRLGMMLWQDQVSGGSGRNKDWPKWTRLQPNPVDAEWPAKQHEQFMYELNEMITLLESHPSIVCWVPFNEAWGQHKTLEVGAWVAKRDPSRLVNIASGGNWWPGGDIVDEHAYPHPAFPFGLDKGRFDNYIKVVGEFGGHGWPVKGHIYDVNRRNWGYGDLPKTEDELKERYATSIKKLNDLRGRGIAAGVYTQTTDVEGEINGLLTYDRKVTKISAAELAKLHEKLFQKALPAKAAQGK